MRRSALRRTAIALALAAALLAPAARAAAQRVDVSVGHAARGAAVPRDFLGLSFEVAALPDLARYASTGNLVPLLQSAGRGVLRIGGVTADSRGWWAGDGEPAPPWGRVAVDRSVLAGIARLARASGWRIVLTVDLAHYDPQGSAREAAAAKAALGSSLVGIEIGNEPNAYASHGWRDPSWGPQAYVRQVAAYRAAIGRLVHGGVPLLGPDVTGSSAADRWSGPFARRTHPVSITGHHYAMSCSDEPPPTIDSLLGASIRAAEDHSLTRYVSEARAVHLPFRLDETGSISCGGQPGVSNTFAGALWAVDYLTRAMSAGVAEVNLHGQIDNCLGYAPLCAPSADALNSGELTTGPEWYALLLLRQLVGEHPARSPGCSCPSGVHTSAFVGSGGRLDVAIVDARPDGRAPVTLALHPGGRYTGTGAVRLTAPARSATGGFHFIHPAFGHSLAVTIPASSATIVTLYPSG